MAGLLGLNAQQVLPFSTGVIMETLPVERIEAALPVALGARTKPSSPVPALALPVLISRARMPTPAARCARQTCTGAAQKRFRVNTPATDDPSTS